MNKITTIEIQFPIPVDLPDKFEQQLADLVDDAVVMPRAKYF